MPAYSFEALSATGETRKGTIDSDSAKGARSLLRSQGLVPLAVVAVGAQSKDGSTGSGLNRSLWTARVFNATALAIWTR